MKIPPWLTTALLVFSIPAPAAPGADLVNGQAARSVLGKPDFVTDGMLPASASTTGSVEGLAVDPTSGKVFVADRDNNRILRFSATAAYQSGAAAEAVFGQADFVSNEANRGDPSSPSAETLSDPRSLAVDSSGRLWVADVGNERVLRFDNASSKPSSSPADAVLGQLLFTTRSSGKTQSKFGSPNGVAIDAAGNLWVSDSDNCRILRFDAAATKPNGAPADGVLGQADFTSNSFGTTASMTDSPFGLSVDSDGRLWVADLNNARILRFDNAATKSNGAPADGVLGQTDFSTATVAAVSASSFEDPYYVHAAPDGTVWVGDLRRHRVLGFFSAAGKPDGAPADRVLGQPDFTSSANPGTSASSIPGPSQMATGTENSLLVADLESLRVTRFSTAMQMTAPSRANARNGRVTIRGTAGGVNRVQYQIKGQGGFRKSLGAPSNWRTRITSLTKPQTNVEIRAIAFDGFYLRKVVKVLDR